MTERIIRDRLPARIIRQNTQGPAGAGIALESTDTLEVRLVAGAHRLAGLRTSTGAALANPCTVAAAGGANHWHIRLPTSRPVDLLANDEYHADLSRLIPGNIIVYPAAPVGASETEMYDVRVFAAITAPATATLAVDGSIEVTFTEAVSGVTCVGNGSGTLEATDGISYAPSVSGANAVWTLAPPVVGWVGGSVVTITIKPTIAAVADATQLYDGLGFLLDVAADVTAPVMTGFVVEATSADANIAISALSASGTPSAYQVSMDPAFAGATWQSAAAWLAAGFASGLAAGQTQSVTLHARAKDITGNIGAAISAVCEVSIPAAEVITLDPATKNAALTLSGGNLTAVTATAAWTRCFSTTGKTTGKWAVEAVLNSATDVADFIAGFVDATRLTDSDGFPGDAVDGGVSVGWHNAATPGASTGLKWVNGVNSAVWPAVAPGTKVQLLIDADTRTMRVKTAAHGLDADTAVLSGSAAIWFSLALYRTSNGTVNFGATAFTVPLETGYSSWDGSQTA
jgi:hypothetical protein